MKNELVPPIFIFDIYCCDVSAHDSVEAASLYMEPFDVEEESSFGFDSVGQPLTFSVIRETRVRIEAAKGSPRPEELESRLREYFQHDERFADLALSLPALVEMAAARARSRDVRHPVLSFFWEGLVELSRYLWGLLRRLTRQLRGRE